MLGISLDVDRVLREEDPTYFLALQALVAEAERMQAQLDESRANRIANAVWAGFS